METKDLFKILTQKVVHRVDIYFAQSKVDKYFKDQGFIVNEVTKSANEGEEIGVSIFKIVSGKISGGRDVTERIVIDSRDKAKIIESIKNKPNELFHYKGPGHFTYWEETLNLYEPNQNELIQNERIRQEKIFEKKTVLFTFQIDDTIYASIAMKDNFDLGMLASYGPLESHGLLGLIERKLEEKIVLINPFWIWHEN